MDRELFKKTEGRLYTYFRYKKEIINSKRRIEFLESKVSEIDESIKNVHKYVNIDPYQNGAGISERVQTSSTGTSYVESEMIKEVSKLEKEQCNTMKSILKLQLQKRDKEKYVQRLDTNIEMLNEEEKRFVELKYGDEKGVQEIADKLNMARATAYRKREELVENISHFMNLIK
jgi:DNA-directed RNA polymerase specialized sigma subunit